ncbi:Endonuclease/exonuclease/phosphatase [Kribbella flavida DSM 17836]|uniref:Endonuclease/exonuclease/phosphatase n=1 Tax=Kribbella flavida (strain DSM 17836 / JCM 10339 / NBRC 14399) TaxID=479435 RepID=D2PUH4_KRIFD|nr:endonuclease/exonuclease/phosphatase family protein [Kribbella flavida]ADB29492.1 Endonuclease/exonuclease/phosphatase [Kribbella flavida DSM 17836]
MRYRVLTLNVQNDVGDPRRFRLINEELRRLSPDLVALQEVCYPAGSNDQLAELLEGTGLTHRTHQRDVLPDLPELFRHDGTAIATRHPHRVAEVLEHRGTGVRGDPHWWTLAVTVDLGPVGEVLAITPTTPWQLDHEYARERQALDIAALDARHRTALPTVLAGDFNATPDSASIRFLSGHQSLDGTSVHFHDAWTTRGEGPGHTWTTANPLAREEIATLIGQSPHHRRLDYIFVGSRHAHPDTQATIDTVDLVGVNPPLSDHYGLVADLTLL